MWKNVVESDRTKMTIWRLHIAFWIPKKINAHSGYVIVITFPLQQWLPSKDDNMANAHCILDT
jgi:hypothetical protein